MTDDALRETYVSGEEKFHGKIINVEHWQVSLPNGKTALREVVRHNGAAAIVPVDDEGYVTLVRQEGSPGKFPPVNWTPRMKTPSPAPSGNWKRKRG